MQELITDAHNWVDDKITYFVAGNTMRVYDYTFKLGTVTELYGTKSVELIGDNGGDTYIAYQYKNETNWTIAGYYSRDGDTPFEAMARIAANEF